MLAQAILRRDDITGNATAIAEACGSSDVVDRIGLRIGGIFIILVTSLVGTLFPLASKRVPFLRRVVPGAVFEAARYFGSGVILATALIHLLEPAADEEINPDNIFANGGCLPNGWSQFPFAYGICLASLFATFVGELFAYRFGVAHFAKVGIDMDGRGCGLAHSGHQAATPAEIEAAEDDDEDVRKVLNDSSSNDRHWRDSSEDMPAGAQILGCAILEAGILFHSVIIGMTLALSGDEFTTLLIVLVFHQAFEGLGLGARLAYLRLPASWNWVPFTGAILYSAMTPLGMVIGLAAKESINMSSTQASISSGVLDSISAGILLYSATVELMAHEFTLNPYWRTAPLGKICYALGCFALGAGLMALLGHWA